MRLPDLRELDRRVLPDAAVRLRAVVDGAGAARRRAGRGARRVWRAGTGTLATWAERVDNRYASSGPLALVRDVPQLALLLVAVVFVSGAFAAVWLAEPERSGAAAAPDPTTLLRQASVGVPPGADVDEHLAGARDVVTALAERRPDIRYLALVSLDRYLPVAELAGLVQDLAPQRVYLRAPGVEEAEVVEVPLAGSGADAVLPALCTATSARFADDAANLRSLAATIEATTPEEELQRADFESEAARAEAEAAAFGGGCGTAFAVIVEAEAETLAALLDIDAVRGVEAAPSGVSVLDLTVTPLLPEVSGRVPTGTER